MSKIPQWQTWFIVCEGASEEAYVKALGQFLRDYEVGLRINFRVVNAGGGRAFSKVKEAVKDLQKKYPKECRAYVHMRIMVDRDCYARSKTDRKKYEEAKASLPRFLFQYFNFEDFLLMHFSAEIVEAWRKESAAHFKRPWTAGEYMPKFKAFVEEHKEALKSLQNYKKGDVFPLTQEHLENLFQNNTQDGLPRSDFAAFLKDLIPEPSH